MTRKRKMKCRKGRESAAKKKKEKRKCSAKKKSSTIRSNKSKAVSKNKSKSSNRKKNKKKAKKINIKKMLGKNPTLRRHIIDIGGEQALAIIQALRNDKCTEDVIIKRTRAGKSDVRAALNKLHGKGIVKYVREKDENIGLYTYTWSLRIEKLVQLGEKLLLQNENMNKENN